MTPTKTYIPKQPKHTRERLEVKLDRTLLQQLDRYCEYLESDRDYVLACVLQIAFRKDKGFGEWLRGKDAGLPTATADTAAARRTGR